MTEQTLVKARELQSVCTVDEVGRKSNLEWVLARGLPSVKQLPDRAEPLAIIGSGPSVRGHLEELRSWPGEIWAINGAYDYLRDNGIIPHGFFAIDPLPGMAEYVSHADHKTTFYIASTCDPSVFEALKDHKVQIFHAACEDVDYPKDWVIGGGTTALTRVPYLGLLQGFRDITIFGADSSYEAGREYCYDWGRYGCDIASSRFLVEVNGEGPFETELGLLKQVSQMGVIHKNFRGNMSIRCGGLMDAFMRAPTIDDSWIEVEKSDAA